MSEEQKEHLRRLARERQAQKAAAAVAKAPPEPVVAEDESGDNILGQLAGLFQQASSKKSGRDKAVNDALEILGRLDPREYPEIADNEMVQDFVTKVQNARAKAADLPPGTIVGSGISVHKVPWEWHHLRRSQHLTPEEARAQGLMEWVEYTPLRDQYVGWNGLFWYFRRRRRERVPKCFVDVFEEGLNQEEFAEQHAAWLMNRPGVRAHRDFFTTNAPRLKAMDESRGEYYQPGAGLIDLAPSKDLLELAGVGAEEET
jgi:hypothetical protein